MRAWVVLGLLSGCGDKVSSDAEAELAWTGLEAGVQRALRLGLVGYDAASSANIDDQSEAGDTSGTLTVGGQVDQGESDNKGLRLSLTMDDYSDTLGDDGEPDLLYDTAGTPAELDVQLRGIPDGSLSGTLVGTFAMAGVLEGDVDLDVTLQGTLEADPDYAEGVRLVEDFTRVEGTATSDYGVYDVELTY